MQTLTLQPSVQSGRVIYQDSPLVNSYLDDLLQLINPQVTYTRVEVVTFSVCLSVVILIWKMAFNIRKRHQCKIR